MRRSGVLISDRDPRQLLHPLLPGETHRGMRRPSVDRPGALTRPRALTLDSLACRVQERNVCYVRCAACGI